MTYTHICTLESRKSAPKNATKFHFTSISPRNPRTKLYFRSMASIVKERELHMSTYSYIIHPMSLFRFYWTIVMAILVIVSLLLTPINAVHVPNLHRNRVLRAMFLCENVLDGMFVLDLILTCFLGVIHKSEPNLKPRIIYKYYVKSLQFYLDLLTSIPSILIPTCLNEFVRPRFPALADYLGYFTMVKILRLRKFLAYFNEITRNDKNRYYNNFLFKYSILIVVCLHYLSCAMMIILLFRDVYDRELYRLIPSLNYGLIATSDTLTLYCFSMYILTSYIFVNGMVMIIEMSLMFQITKIIDIVMFFLFSIVGFITYTFILVLLLQLKLSINYSYTKYHSILSQVSKYLSYKNLPKNKRRRVLVYYEYKYQKRYYAEKNIMLMLSETLRREIYFHSCRTLIESVSLLKDLPAEIIAEVVANLKQEIFLYNDIIVKAGTTGDCMYFIANGSVSVSTPTGREICHLQDGAYFGEIALISKDQRRVANVVAIEICEMYRLDRKNFKTCFLTNTSQYRKLEQMAKERMDKTLLLEELHKKYIMEKSKKFTPLPDAKRNANI